MRRNESTVIFLGFLFIAIMVSGLVITVSNYQKWSRIHAGVLREYKRLQNVTENGDGSLNTSESENGDGINTPGYENGNGVQNTTGSGEIIPEGSDQNGSYIENNSNNQTIEDQTVISDVNGSNRADIAPGTDGTKDTEGTAGEAENMDNTKKKVMGTIEGFYITGITEDIFARINGKSFREGCPVSVDELRYIHIRHYGFEGELKDGELIVNEAIAKDTLEIFEELYRIKYPIEKVRLVDEYDADDERSMEDNNSSCFNYRTIAETNTLSNHAYGRAIDINPFYNPYVYERVDGSLFLQPNGSEKYIDRTVDADCIIQKGDACYNIFTAHGFKWGGDWTPAKDYQHFEKLQ